ncbi:MAG TPA: porin [Gemmatimonadaceae bacterium]
MTASPSHAAVEFMRVCSLYGASFFFIPGTDTCTNAGQIVEDQFAVARALTRAATGTAMAASLVNPFLPDGTNYAISTHWAVFDGSVGFAGLIRLWGNLALSAGVAVGLDRGRLLSLSDRTQTEFGTSVPAQSWSDVRVLGRVGLQYSW